MVLFFNSRLKLFLGKLTSRWPGQFRIKQVRPYDVVELEVPNSNEIWKISGKRLEMYLSGEIHRFTTTIPLNNP